MEEITSSITDVIRGIERRVTPLKLTDFRGKNVYTAVSQLYIVSKLLDFFQPKSLVNPNYDVYIRDQSSSIEETDKSILETNSNHHHHIQVLKKKTQIKILPKSFSKRYYRSSLR